MPEQSRHSTMSRDDKFDSRRASLAMWRSTPLFSRQSQIGDPLPPGWAKATTEDGTPYYVNHQTRETQWNDPRLDACVEELSVHDDIRFSVYRTAVKLRDIQVYLRLSKIHLSSVLNAFHKLNLSATEGLDATKPMSADEMATVLLEVYASLPNPYSLIDTLISWIFHVYDKKRTGLVSLRCFKTCIALMSVSWLEEKYRFLFGVFDGDADGLITPTELALFIKTSSVIVDAFGEGYPFLPSDKALQEAVNDCCKVEYQRTQRKDVISLESFLEWIMSEPRCLIWLPTLHRVAATENVKHETVCCVCKMYPIIGFRYRSMSCMDKDVCQDCFWTGREGNGHKITHELKEYCFPPTAKQDSKDFTKKFSKKFKRLFTKKKNKPLTELTAEGFPPLPKVDIQATQTEQVETSDQMIGDEGDANSLDRLSAQLHDAAIGDEHDLIRNLAQQLNQDEGQSATVVSLEAEQKLHLLRVIDELDAENRHLLKQVMDQQDTSSLPQESSAMDDDVKDALEARVTELSERNRDLAAQLNRLQALLADDDLDDSDDEDEENLYEDAIDFRGRSVEELKSRLSGDDVDDELHVGQAPSPQFSDRDNSSDDSTTVDMQKIQQQLDQVALSTEQNLQRGLPIQPDSCSQHLRDAMAATRAIQDAMTRCTLIVRSHLDGDVTSVQRLSQQSRVEADRSSIWGEESFRMLETQEKHSREGTSLSNADTAMMKQTLEDQVATLHAQLSRMNVDARLGVSFADFSTPIRGNSAQPIDEKDDSDADDHDYEMISEADLANVSTFTNPSQSFIGDVQDVDVDEDDDSLPPPPPRQPRPSEFVFKRSDSSTAIAQARDEIQRTAGFLNPRDRPRAFSQERLESLHHNITERMRAVASNLQDILGVEMPVSDDNIVITMFRKLMDGFFLCQLVNMKLEKYQKPKVNAFKPNPAETMGLAQAAKNFDSFEKGVRELLGENCASAVPNYQEMTSWELYGVAPERSIVTRLIMIIEDIFEL